MSSNKLTHRSPFSLLQKTPQRSQRLHTKAHPHSSIKCKQSCCEYKPPTKLLRTTLKISLQKKQYRASRLKPGPWRLSQAILQNQQNSFQEEYNNKRHMGTTLPYKLYANFKESLRYLVQPAIQVNRIVLKSRREINEATGDRDRRAGKHRMSDSTLKRPLTTNNRVEKRKAIASMELIGDWENRKVDEDSGICGYMEQNRRAKQEEFWGWGENGKDQLWKSRRIRRS